MTADVVTLEYILPPAIYAPVAAQENWQGERVVFRYDATTNESVGFAAQYSKLRSLATQQSLWPKGSAGPSAWAIKEAREILEQLQTENLLPARVVASAEGGVALCFVRGDKYADIETLNSGEILGVVANRRDRPSVWEVQQNARGFASAAARIREFLYFT